MLRLLYLTTALSLAFGSLAAQQPQKNNFEREGAIAYNKGSEYYSAGNFAESIPYLLAADSLIGDSLESDRRLKLRFTIGRAYLKSDRPEKALEYFEWVAGRDSSHPYIYLQLATTARKAGKPAEAMKYYKSALPRAVDSQKPAILIHIAALLEKRKNWKGALATYNQAVALDPQAEYYYRRGIVFNRLAAPLDHADDEGFDFEEAVNSGELTEKALLRANQLREKALADFRLAAQSAELVEEAARMIERTEVMINNNQMVISEIHYLRKNE